MNFAKMSDRFLTLTLIRTSLLTEAVQVVAAVAAGNLLRKSPRLSHPDSPVFAVGIAKTWLRLSKRENSAQALFSLTF